MIERLLLIGADFNALDAEGRVLASIRYAATPEIPTVGEWVRLEDAEEDSCLARVEDIHALTIVARPDWSTWLPGDVARLSQVFSSRTFVEYASTEPSTAARGKQLLPR